MSGHPKANEPEKGTPTCGILSIAAPLIGVPIALGIGRNVQGESWGFGGVIVFIFLSLGALLVGLISALVGLHRGERVRFLSVLGLILNVGIFLWAVTRH